MSEPTWLETANFRGNTNQRGELMVMGLTEVPVSGIQLLLRIITHPEDNVSSPKIE